MNIVSALAMVAVVGWISGCSTVPESQISNVNLDATRFNPGQIAQATMMPSDKGTDFWFAVSGEPVGNTLPGRLTAYIYSGSCASLGAKPAYDLNHGPNARFYSQASLQYFWKSAPVPVDTLRKGGYVLVVRESPASGDQNLFCGSLS
ncbi:hypothetical protein [Pseudomonas akapageensis]|uniref:hypothetical protein n=1 Tax=Pseudomonas akapageensis TaxID=2609961 RepID=UPI00140A60BC|nr:hypothetical protein [Pseudomonas akapageensis]